MFILNNSVFVIYRDIFLVKMLFIMQKWGFINILNGESPHKQHNKTPFLRNKTDFGLKALQPAKERNKEKLLVCE